MPEEKLNSEKRGSKDSGRPAKIICLALIRFYRIFLSPLKPQVCRFYPTCSQYTYEAVNKYGPGKGLLMGFNRIIRCHPFNPGGYHPVE